MKHNALDGWTCQDAAELYAVRNWGAGYFDINEKGEVVVKLRGRAGEVVCSLIDIANGLKERGLSLPVLLRFSDILDSRITILNETFRRCMAEAGYKGQYRGVYPIKVNQQHQIVEELVRFGSEYHHGLEAGSKAELIAALAYMHDPEAYVVCNGYKDEEFIDLALYALKMGIQTLVVVETPGELGLILREAERIGVRPRIGVRAKLASRGGGKWSESGGDRSVFGLNTAQIIDVVDELRRRSMLDCLQMLHHHIGSQIPNISHIRAAIYEASRYYVDLVQEGAAMGILNIGGGLAVDYDGSHTNFASSSNYDIREYCADVIEVIMSVADNAGVPHPTIISESGRATVAHHSVLLFNILDVSRLESHGIPEKLDDDAPELLRSLMEVSQSLSEKNIQESYHDAVYYREEIRSAFEHGAITLRQRAIAEQAFWHIVTRIARDAQTLKYVPDELQGLSDALADVYYGNFSVFQSLPDAWAIEQLFPVMPIHRLREYPNRMATLADITCDCEGKIDRFIDLHDVRHALPLHEPKDNEDYILGVFLVGAYQETLGDLHNLFGDTNVVNLRLSEQGDMEFAGEIQGDTVADVLSYIEYNPKTLGERFRELAEQAVRSKQITAVDRREILNAYESGLRGYTYFES